MTTSTQNNYRETKKELKTNMDTHKMITKRNKMTTMQSLGGLLCVFTQGLIVS